MTTKIVLAVVIGLLLGVVALPLIFLCPGCPPPPPQWRERQIPTTDAERKAVAEMTEKILAGTPHTLSGHDQDWDDAIKAAQEAACEACCRPTYWEYTNPERVDFGMRPTGRWRYGPEADAHR